MPLPVFAGTHQRTPEKVTLDRLSLPVQRWVHSVFAGIEDSFYLPKRFTLPWVRLVHQWKQYDVQRRRFENQYGRILARELERIAGVTAEAWRSSSIELTLSAMTRELNPMLYRVIPDLYRDVETYFVSRAQQSIREEKAGFDTVNPFDIPDLLSWTGFVTASKIVGLDTVTRQRINALLVEIIRNNLSIFDAQKLIQRDYAFSKVRAYRIARTEVIGAANAATHYGILDGVGTANAAKMTKTWLSTNDRRTRATHVIAGASQRDIPYKDPFKVGSSELLFPGDGSLGAAAKEVIQCRCTALYFLPPLPRRVR